jgi:aminoglycoside/choline kinase family phosphotransferase
VRHGKPYSAIAHLAEDVVPFVALARGLRAHGLSAPEIYAADLDEGLLVLEDLGAEPVVAGESAIEERYAAAVDALVTLHCQQQLPTELRVAPGLTYKLPAYDLEALMIEVELLTDWYLPHQDQELSEPRRAEFVRLWRQALVAATEAPPTWVLRDYHSPNLIWLPDREGGSRAGVLDFQDAVIGPAAYDLVSLLQDARVDVPQTVEDALLGRYMKARRAADREFDLGEFIALYSLMGAQRATKVLGIFSRLHRRDGKPQYLRHQPRVWRNLRRSLAHPSLKELKLWYETNVRGPRTA